MLRNRHIEMMNREKMDRAPGGRRIETALSIIICFIRLVFLRQLMILLVFRLHRLCTILGGLHCGSASFLCLKRWPKIYPRHIHIQAGYRLPCPSPARITALLNRDRHDQRVVFQGAGNAVSDCRMFRMPAIQGVSDGPTRAAAGDMRDINIGIR